MAADDFFIAHRSDRFDPVRFDLQRSTDPQRAIQSVAEVFCPHRIVHHERGVPLDFRHSSARIDRTTFNQIAYGSAIDVVIEEVNRAQYIFVLPLRGEMHVIASAEARTISVGDYMLMGPDVPYQFIHEVEDSHLAVSVPRRMIELGDECYSGPGVGIGPEPMTDIAGTLVDYLSFVCREFARGGVAFESATVRAGTEDTVAGLIKAMLNSRAASASPTLSPAPVHVHLAEKFMDSHLHDDLKIEAIALAAKVPERTLHHAFSRFRGMSPLQWLRARRLECARRAILASAGHANILEIANRYGMQHGGRFAIYYQQRFHEKPSDTLRTARFPRAGSNNLPG
ncbi:AraC family transcriptional regulator [Methylobacterium sp. CM6244]